MDRAWEPGREQVVGGLWSVGEGVFPAQAGNSPASGRLKTEQL